jgi:hypothetical protein
MEISLPEMAAGNLALGGISTKIVEATPPFVFTLRARGKTGPRHGDAQK